MQLCIRADFADCLPSVGALLTEQGRMKFVRPLYRELYQRGGEARSFALDLFSKHRAQYHSIAQKMVARDLKLE